MKSIAIKDLVFIYLITLHLKYFHFIFVFYVKYHYFCLTKKKDLCFTVDSNP